MSTLLKTETIDRNPIRVHGSKSVKLNDTVIFFNFLVADIKYPVIGRDFLISVGDVVDHAKHILSFSCNIQKHECAFYLEEPEFVLWDLDQ